MVYYRKYGFDCAGDEILLENGCLGFLKSNDRFLMSLDYNIPTMPTDHCSTFRSTMFCVVFFRSFTALLRYFHRPKTAPKIAILPPNFEIFKSIFRLSYLFSG